MGRIKELKDKLQKDGLSEEEQKELDTLLAEAKDAGADGAEDEDLEPSDDDVEEEAKKLVDAISKQNSDKDKALNDKLDKVLSAIEGKGKDDPKDKDAPQFIVDKQLGKVPVAKLEEVEVKLPGRENKQYKSVTAKTLHFIDAMLRDDKQKIQVLVEGTTTLGGFLVPEEWANVIDEDRRDAVVMRQLAEVITLNTDTFNYPLLDTRPHVQWRSEAAVKSTSTVQWSQIVLTPYSVAGIVTLSRELTMDASVGGSVVNAVTNYLVRAIAEEEEVVFWTGSGSGRPTGIDNYTFVTINPGAGATDTQRADSYFQAYHRLPQGYRNVAAWAMNARTMGRLRTLKDTNNQYLLQGLGVTPQPTLLGRPVYEVNAIGDGKVFFGDFSDYKIAQREGVRVDTSDSATVASYSAFERNLLHVRVEERVDGELVRTTGIVELNNMGAI